MLLTIIFITLFGTLSYASNPDITTYEFISDQSCVLQKSGIADVNRGNINNSFWDVDISGLTDIFGN